MNLYLISIITVFDDIRNITVNADTFASALRQVELKDGELFKSIKRI